MRISIASGAADADGATVDSTSLALFRCFLVVDVPGDILEANTEPTFVVVVGELDIGEAEGMGESLQSPT